MGAISIPIFLNYTNETAVRNIKSNHGNTDTKKIAQNLLTLLCICKRMSRKNSSPNKWWK